MSAGRRLIALDIDGTVMHEDGTITDAVVEAITRVVAQGDEVMLATGRSPSTTLPVVARLGISPEFVICCNGAVTLRRDPEAEGGYRPDVVETFDPTEVLETIRRHLPDARYAVEDADGAFSYTEAFPGGAVMGAETVHVPFEELLGKQSTRVVVISPGTGIEEFTELVERMGLHQVSYAIGWTAWLDIAPHGVNKSTALELVRDRLGIERSDVVALGDGRNDIEMLTWAAEHGAGLAMGRRPPRSSPSPPRSSPACTRTASPSPSPTCADPTRRSPRALARPSVTIDCLSPRGEAGRAVRAADGASLENWWAEMSLGFESLALRHCDRAAKPPPPR